MQYGTSSKNLYLNNELISELIISDSVTSIGSSAFKNCTSLTSIVIPDSVVTINDSVFEGCTSLASVEIGSSVTSIGVKAFLNCTGLTSTIIKATAPPTINSNTFYSVTNAHSFYGPLASIDAYKTAINWGAYRPQMYPYVETTAELSAVDTTAYTKANVNGVEYTYDGTNWVEVIL